jgi:hypothetical protein
LGEIPKVVGSSREGGATELATAQADANGSYRFDEVAAGEYDVVLEVPPAAQATGSNPFAVMVEEGRPPALTSCWSCCP